MSSTAPVVSKAVVANAEAMLERLRDTVKMHRQTEEAKEKEEESKKTTEEESKKKEEESKKKEEEEFNKSCCDRLLEKVAASTSTSLDLAFEELGGDDATRLRMSLRLALARAAKARGVALENYPLADFDRHPHPLTAFFDTMMRVNVPTPLCVVDWILSGEKDNYHEIFYGLDWIFSGEKDNYHEIFYGLQIDSSPAVIAERCSKDDGSYQIRCLRLQ